MTLQLDHLASRDLARELLDRVPAIVRRQLARSLRRTPRLSSAVARSRAAPVDRTAFANFNRQDGPSIPLLSAYRNRIKARWPNMFWPARLLLQLDALTQLPPSLREVATAIRAARTLPLALPELFSMVQPVTMEHPDLVLPTGRHDPFVGADELTIAPTSDQIRLRVEYNLGLARRLLRYFRRTGVGTPDLRVLEQGCGSGHTTMALAALGVGEAVGIDIDWDRTAADIDWRRMREEFLRVDKRSATARIEVGDAMAMAFSDETFDIVHSTVTLEHITRPELALREAYRVLRSGGVAYFEVGPWFGPDGGHSLCTLDCPWGHARLSAAEFENYLGEYRPHEAAAAMDFYRTGFQSPRRTMAEVATFVVGAGFRILDWYESRQAYADHYDFLTPELLVDCQRHNPLVSVGDLMTSSYTVLAAKA